MTELKYLETDTLDEFIAATAAWHWHRPAPIDDMAGLTRC
jgi:hypothetical protein